jgi:hypothetical protein
MKNGTGYDQVSFELPISPPELGGNRLNEYYISMQVFYLVFMLADITFLMVIPIQEIMSGSMVSFFVRVTKLLELLMHYICYLVEIFL